MPTKDAILLIYDQVHLALWALLIAWLIWFAIMVVPNIPKARAQWELERNQQVMAENESYCGKWNMGPSTPAHDQCILDLQAFRAMVAHRLADDDVW